MLHEFLLHACFFLSAAVFFVPLVHYLGLNSVIGYLIAGVVIGPYGLALLGDVKEIFHFAELGVVLLLFVIGLEIHPEKMMRLRRSVFLLGGAQVGLTSLILTGLFLAFGLSAGISLLMGLAFSLSSTAFVLNLLEEENELQFSCGQSAFGILLLQDLVVIPLLALVPIIGSTSTFDSSFIWTTVAKGTGSVILLISVGHFLLKPVFRLLIKNGEREITTAASLLTVVATALFIESIGLSMGLGALIAGMLLAGFEHRTEIEDVMSPFKGMLMGLFFMAVGMSINFSVVFEKIFMVLFVAVLFMVVKGILIYGLFKTEGYSAQISRRMGILLCQGGEFGIYILSSAHLNKIISDDVADLFIATLTLSMAINPLFLFLYDKAMKRQSRLKS